MARLHTDGSILRVETNRYHAAVQTAGYVSGVMAGSFLDKKTGARDVGFGLCIIDFLLQPGTDDQTTPKSLQYHWGDAFHGQIPKRYVELPQICTQAKELPFEIVEGEDFIAVRQWFQWRVAQPVYRSGSLWEQWLVFPDGVRWFFVYDKITSVNAVDNLLLRMDMPGHLKHQQGDTFIQIYLSYEGLLDAQAFAADFAPDERFLYRREATSIPKRFIRAYQLPNNIWLAGMTLEPSAVYEAWCHQRGYVCFIQEIGGHRISAGESFGAVHLVGFFDRIDEMTSVFDDHSGTTAIRIEANQWRLCS